MSEYSLKHARYAPCEWPDCGAEPYESSICPECEAAYCNRHGDMVCAQCIENDLRNWVDWLDENPEVIDDLRYRIIRRPPREDLKGIPFLTSSAARREAWKAPEMGVEWVAEERDGDQWIPLTEDRELERR